MSKAICRTCGSSVDNHVPSMLDPNGVGATGHKLVTTQARADDEDAEIDHLVSQYRKDPTRFIPTLNNKTPDCEVLDEMMSELGYKRVVAVKDHRTVVRYESGSELQNISIPFASRLLAHFAAKQELAELKARRDEVAKAMSGYSWIEWRRLKELKLDDGTKTPLAYIERRLAELDTLIKAKEQA